MFVSLNPGLEGFCPASSAGIPVPSAGNTRIKEELKGQRCSDKVCPGLHLDTLEEFQQMLCQSSILQVPVYWEVGQEKGD